MKKFTNYEDWRLSMIQRAKIDFTAEYCAGRASALRDPQAQGTSEFRRVYGEAYTAQIISFFERAEEEASSNRNALS